MIVAASAIFNFFGKKYITVIFPLELVVVLHLKYGIVLLPMFLGSLYSLCVWHFLDLALLLVFVFVLKGRGTVATGRVEQGIVKVGEEVEILGLRQVNMYFYFFYFWCCKPFFCICLFLLFIYVCVYIYTCIFV